MSNQNLHRSFSYAEIEFLVLFAVTQSKKSGSVTKIFDWGFYFHILIKLHRFNPRSERIRVSRDI
jgi:hypothetical protein